MTDATFPKSHRLLASRDFQHVRSEGVSASDGTIRVSICQNELAHARLGLVVSRRVGNAVRRNLWKRKLREAFRLMQSTLPSGIDLVIIPSKSETPEVQDLQRAIKQLVLRLQKRLRAKE